MEVGHNQDQRLKSFVDRINNLEDQKKEIGADIRDVYTEAAGTGYDKKALREIVRRKRADQEKLAEHETLVETYMAAMGML